MLRSSSPADKRVKLLRLTLENERVPPQLETAERRVQQRSLKPLARADRAVTLRLLAQLAAVRNTIIPAPRQATDRG